MTLIDPGRPGFSMSEIGPITTFDMGNVREPINEPINGQWAPARGVVALANSWTVFEEHDPGIEGSRTREFEFRSRVLSENWFSPGVP
jgi:hypothetical protein